jgi:hypothetical protein
LYKPLAGTSTRWAATPAPNILGMSTTATNLITVAAVPMIVKGVPAQTTGKATDVDAVTSVARRCMQSALAARELSRTLTAIFVENSTGAILATLLLTSCHFKPEKTNSRPKTKRHCSCTNVTPNLLTRPQNESQPCRLRIDASGDRYPLHMTSSGHAESVLAPHTAALGSGSSHALNAPLAPGHDFLISQERTLATRPPPPIL